MRRIKIVFCVAGMGLGNATRVKAIIDSILASTQKEVSITVFAWGKSFEFFSAKSGKEIELVRLASYLQGKTHSNIYHWKFLAFLPIVFIRYWQNSKIIFQAIRGNKPDVAVLDSDFSFFPFFALNVPVVAISQAPFVAKKWLLHHPRTGRIGFWIRFFFFELSDLALNCIFARRILVPSISPIKSGLRKIQPIDLIVRENFRAHGENDVRPIAENIKIGLIRSGSGLAKEKIDRLVSEKAWIDLNAKSDPPGETGLVPVLQQAQFIATQCGLSSLSECIACRKPMILLPIDMHPEQLINSKELIRLGLGVPMEDYERGITPKHPEAPSSWPGCNGASQSASMILSMARG